ncbi:hypothetical protein WICPIJ_002097 [Wickerhamomyces pijperi]|uniref:Condensin complex subunit 2 n=1 Tax=Wickerhamomyces pijperi TaxID=599730 RepID=A0A9P8QAH2_WICPI|nr:hypothetical protein WICPIJ_002097 [Wickerhamomyces pijperi]
MSLQSQMLKRRGHRDQFGPRANARRVASGGDILRQQLARDDSQEAGSTGNASTEDDQYVLPADQHTINSNFEEWIKMATDNKINSSNSWNFQLIDYFHDLNILKGNDDNINFQKASATLDGCVKIYSSRVDSVVTETGRLLSGLTQKQAKGKRKDGESQERGQEGEEEQDQESNEDEDALIDEPQKKNRNKVRPANDTLVKFGTIRLKKLDEDLNIDPLFKKTLAEFDEGGAKSLLLNTLGLDWQLHVVFDASTTNGNAEKEDIEDEVEEVIQEEEDIEMRDASKEIDLRVIESLISAEDIQSEEFALSHRLPQVEAVLQDVSKAKDLLNDMNQEEYLETVPKDVTSYGLDSFGAHDDMGFDDFGGNDDYDDYEEGQPNAIDVIDKELNYDQDQEPGLEEESRSGKLTNTIADNDLMSYFDNTVRNNWNRDNWKVRSFKRQIKPINQDNAGAATAAAALIDEDGNPVVPKKRKDGLVIDFLSVDPDDYEEEDQLFKKGKSLTMPQQSKEVLDHEKETRYLLPDDMFFTSQQLTKLFTKDQYLSNLFRKPSEYRVKSSSEDPLLQQDELAPTKDVDADFWAKNYKEQEDEQYNQSLHHDTAPLGEGDDDGYGDFDAGGFDDFDPDLNTQTVSESQRYLVSDLIKSAGGDKRGVTYAKVAKNVNVKALKDNLWKVIDSKLGDEAAEEGSEVSEPVRKKLKREEKFSDIVHDMEKLYRRDERKDLSTSFCFISLLHLANEHGLTIQSLGEDGLESQLTDLRVLM